MQGAEHAFTARPPCLSNNNGSNRGIADVPIDGFDVRRKGEANVTQNDVLQCQLQSDQDYHNQLLIKPQVSGFMQIYKQWYTMYYGCELKIPKFNKQDLSLEELWNAVMHRGGSKQTTMNKLWAEIGREFNPPDSMTNLSYHIKRIYEKYLLAYEKSISPGTAMEFRHMPRTIPAFSHRFQPKDSNEDLELSSSAKSGSPPSKRVYFGQESGVSNNQDFVERACTGYGELLVGSVIRLWIDLKRSYELVKVVGYDPDKKTHTIRFSNGSQNSVELCQYTWSTCSEDCDVQNAQTNRPTHATLPEFIPCSSVRNEPLPLNKDDIGVTTTTRFPLPLSPQHHPQHPSPNLCNACSKCVVEQERFSNLLALVKQQQSLLETSRTRILELEERATQLHRQLSNAKLDLSAREQQHRIVVSELTMKLREANEARSLAEGAVNELRQCFEYLLRANSNTNIDTNIGRNDRTA